MTSLCLFFDGKHLNIWFQLLNKPLNLSVCIIVNIIYLWQMWVSLGVDNSKYTVSDDFMA